MSIDLQADLGEGFGRWSLDDDQTLLTILSSAHSACGFHAGDPNIMRRVTQTAARNGVVLGAHVGYRDLAGFGRRFIDILPSDLTNDVIYQLGALEAFTRLAGNKVRYVKPHGALYNAIVHHEEQAKAVAEGVKAYDPDLPVLGLPGSAWLRAADKAGLKTYNEAFADRFYTPEGTLVPRRDGNAVRTDIDDVAEHCLRLASGDGVIATDGSVVPMPADSLCVHGDSPGAIDMARAVRERLTSAGVEIRPFING